MSSTQDGHHLPVLSQMSLEDRPADVKHPTGPLDKPEQIVNPWEVQGADEYGVDYDKLIETFGTRKIDQETLDRFEKLTGHKPHRFLRRGYFFSQRYLVYG